VKKSLIVLSILLLSVSLMAQVRTGTIYGHITDTQGAPLPGVSVTLISPFSAPVTNVTDDQGIFRFPSLEPSSKYALTAELQGFKKQEKTGVIVVIGQQSKIDMTLEQGKLEEQVTVVAVTPTVDAKKTSVGKNITQEILQSLPTSRDPWNVMQMAPSIIEDRENVGGNESGQQAAFIAKGAGGGNNVWAVDGIVVTDPSAIGGSPIYWDFDSFEEMNIVTGGADVTVQTGGISLNMVTRRGGNKVSFGGRFYLTDSQFQANNLTQSLKDQGVARINKVNSIKDFGFNVGGPVIKDKAWLWGSYGVQDIDTIAMNGTPLKPLITDYTGKLNLQPIPSNRFEAMYIAGAKKFLGRSASEDFPEGFDQDSPYHFGDPIMKIQDEQMVGNDLLISAKFAYMNASFQLIPHSDPGHQNLVTYNATTGVGVGWDPVGGGTYYVTTRPMKDYNLNLQYYNDKLFGASHEIKLGVEYSTRRVTTDSSWAGNVRKTFDLNYEDIDPTGTGNPVRTPGMTNWMLYAQYNLDYGVKQMTAFLQDTVSTGRFNFLLGVRYDRQTPSINQSTCQTVNSNPVWGQYFDSAVATALKAFMPGMTTPNIKPNYRWNVISPRLGITYDLFGTGKTILKLSGSMYGDFMGTGSTSYAFTPYGVFGATMTWYWLDGYNGGVVDGKLQQGEMLVADPTTYAPVPLFVNGSVNPVVSDVNGPYNGTWWYGFTPGSSTPGASRYTVDSNATSSRTWEILATVDHELLPDFSVGLNATWRRYNHFSWNPAYYTNGDYGDYRIGGASVIRDFHMYSVAGQIPASITGVDLGAGAGKDYYLITPGYGYTPYNRRMLNTNYQTFWGVDLVFNKRLTNKWMMDGSLSYMDQKYHYGNGYTNPENLWAQQDQLYAPNLGSSSGKVGQYVFSHWMAKLEGLYQMPFDFNFSFTFNARAGHVVPHYMSITDRRWANSYNRTTGTLWLNILGKQLMPVFYQLNVRLEKLIKLGDTGRIYLMADVFNLLNSAIINRRFDRNEGTWNISALGVGSRSPYASYYRVNEILNPRIARFGVRFQF
jgi:hypothetical protein